MNRYTIYNLHVDLVLQVVCKENLKYKLILY